MAQNTLTQLQAHLDVLQKTPTTESIDERLVDEAALVLPEQLTAEDLQSLVRQIQSTLQTIQQDSTPLTNLLQKLLNPFTFADVLSFDPPVDFAAGLSLGEHMVPFNRLMLYLLQKATSPSDVATVASWPEVTRSLVLLWLCTQDTGIASLASSVFVHLLRIDLPVADIPNSTAPQGGPGQGLMWKRIFSDRDVYGTLYQACDLNAKEKGRGKAEITLAQARLLDWLPKVAGMDWATVSRKHHEEIEKPYGIQDGGLLEYAASKMVDYKDDVLMYRCLIDFFSELLSTTRPPIEATPTAETGHGLQYLINTKLHERTAVVYLQSGIDADPLEAMFLYGPSANYIATYASLYPRHFLKSGMLDAVKRRLVNTLNISPARWAHSESPKHDLHLLASLPRTALLPNGDGAGPWSTSPVALLPSRSTNPDVLDTLGVLFHGPQREIINFPETSPMIDSGHEAKAEEAAAARSIYLNYLANNQTFWKDITVHADTVALKDLALSAIRLLSLVITANWSTQPEMGIPSSLIATPETGHIAIMSPPALEYVLPYLMKPAQTFSNLVGGRGDTESAAYKIAVAKFDALQAFHSRLARQAELEPGQGYEDILVTLSKRLAEGPLSRSGEVGGRIATVEM